MNRITYWLAAGVVIAGFPSAAPAYIGPGAGLSAIGTVIALIGAFVLLIVGFVWYPLKRLLRGRRAKNDPADQQPTDPEA